MTRSHNLIGDGLPDPFFDSYQKEAVECGDIINLISNSDGDYLNIVINKQFLRHLVHSHILYIRKMEAA